MLLNDLHTDDAVLGELGRRLERQRLQRDLTQSEAAELAGIGRATLQRIERGESVQATSLVKLLRALGLLSALDVALPEHLESPIAVLEGQQRRGRRRARGSRGRTPRKRPGEWSWGDEDEPKG
jgi:transcriptional regulator with XRE-family HTH domain